MRRFLPVTFSGFLSSQLRRPAVQKLCFSQTFLLYNPSSGAPKTPEPISVLGSDGASVNDFAPLEKFSDLKDLPEWLSAGLNQMAYPSTTDIQKYTIPALEAGHDLIGLAPTGSGKTVAFAVPALRHVKQNKTGSPSVLVMAPTRELVQQTTKVFQQLTCGAIRVCEAYGGASRESQARRLHMGCEVLVACPGRLKDFLDAGDVSLKHLSFLVFDEADRLLDMGFKPQLDEILSFCDENTKRQTMMWSATWPEEVQGLARDFLSPNRLMIRAGTAGTGLQLNDHINQRVIYVESFNERIEKLIQMIEDGTINDNTDKLIIFVERQSDTENVCESLSQRLGIDRRYVGVIHGGLSQRQRDSVMHQFKQNYIRILVATDVAARGLDIPDVTFVINFQMPKNIDSYCHRIGRTGRAGRSGNACTFIGRGDGGTARQLVDYLQKCKMTVPDDLKVLAEKHNEERRNKFGSSSRGNFGGGRRGGYNNYNRNNSRGRNDQNRFDNRRNFSRNNDGGDAGW